MKTVKFLTATMLVLLLNISCVFGCLGRLALGECLPLGFEEIFSFSQLEFRIYYKNFNMAKDEILKQGNPEITDEDSASLYAISMGMAAILDFESKADAQKFSFGIINLHNALLSAYIRYQAREQREFEEKCDDARKCIAENQARIHSFEKINRQKEQKERYLIRTLTDPKKIKALEEKLAFYQALNRSEEQEQQAKLKELQQELGREIQLRDREFKEKQNIIRFYVKTVIYFFINAMVAQKRTCDLKKENWKNYFFDSEEMHKLYRKVCSIIRKTEKFEYISNLAFKKEWFSKPLYEKFNQN